MKNADIHPFFNNIDFTYKSKVPLITVLLLFWLNKQSLFNFITSSSRFVLIFNQVLFRIEVAWFVYKIFPIWIVLHPWTSRRRQGWKLSEFLSFTQPRWCNNQIRIKSADFYSVLIRLLCFVLFFMPEVLNHVWKTKENCEI